MSGYEVLDLGNLDSWRDPSGDSSSKRFVDKEITTQFMGVSGNALAPGGEAPFWHSHTTLEEIYIFLSGTGQMAVGDDVVDVHEGSVVRVSPGTMRAWRAMPDSDGDLRWLCLRGGGAELSAIGRDGELDKDTPFPWAD